ncbi:sugar ABC transporter substrate-binding lipoprotein [Dictyobacter sp. S3.2.2.5]|uniref:Sugar ABC transporter substrate-binding lipoprotein n=1 Tax=Dictyobacter halimunensis TaxID=3026934 RepID=A0ABQ6FIG6_9CHLR|nr:sugar ABC transporter substrate-binding lipoprotein [Dictyobacter sp. S3.2.2.5]
MTFQDPINEVPTAPVEDTTGIQQTSATHHSLQQGTTRRQFLGTAAKSALALTGASSLGALASACGTSSSGGKSQVTLVWYREGNPNEIALAKKITDKFMAQNPDIKIVIQTGNGANHLQKLNTELAGSSPPDLSMMWELDYGSYARKGVFADLHQFIKNDSEFQNKVFSQEYKPVLDMFTWDGKLYVLPEQVTDTVLFYNKDHVKEAGLQMPTSWDDSSWTWDKFLSYAQKLTQTSGGRVTRYGYAEMWWWGLTACNVFAAANGGNWFENPVNPPANSSNLTDPKIASAIQWYADLTNVHHVAAPSKSLTAQAGYQLFMSGKVSMGVVGHWFYGAFAGASGLNFDIAPIPIGPNGGSFSRTNTGGTGIAISSKTKYPEQAWRFAKYWGGVEATTMRNIWLPPLQNIGYSNAYKQSNAAMQHANLFLDVLKSGNTHSLPISPAWATFSVPWNTVTTDIWDGKKTTSQSLAALDQTINQDIQKFG